MILPSLRWTITALAGMMLLSSSMLLAEQRELKNASSEKIDAVLVLDTSGSMLQTDPQKLRNEGVRLFVQSMREGDRLAIVSFANDTRLIRPLSPFSSEQTEAVLAEINGMESSGLFTDILAGVKSAVDLLKSEEREDASRVVILLSDGKMDPNPAVASAEMRTRALIDELLPEIRASDIKVHTLYFSELADKDLLAQIAAATDGLNWFTPTSEKIHESYTSLFLAVKKPQIVPLTSKGLHIDENVQEATFYVNRDGDEPVTILQPDGQHITASTVKEGVRWFRSQKFEVVTISAPQVGNWQISGLASQEGFATVLTNLKLVSDWSTTLYSGSPALLQARLYDNERPVVLPQMTGSAQYAYQVTPTDRVSEPVLRDFLNDDAKHGDKIENDGIFSAEIRLDEPGEYKLTILLKAPTFERTQQIPFKVKPRLVTLKVEEAEGDHLEAPLDEGEHHAQQPKQFSIELSPELGAYQKLSVKLIAVDAARIRYSIPTVRLGEKGLVFKAKAKVLENAGDYTVQAFVTGETKQKRLKEESNVVHYTHVPVVEEHQPELVEVGKEPAPPAETPWWPFMFLVIAVNAGVGAMCLQLLRKTSGQVAFALPALGPIDSYEKMLGALKARADLNSIELGDPLLTAARARPARDEPEPAAPAPQPETADESEPESEEVAQEDAAVEEKAAEEEEAG